MCAIDDCEPWDVHRRVERRARKTHFCSECGRKIQPGESYTYDTGLADGTWSQFRTCQHCIAAGEWLVVMCGGYPLTQLCEELYEHIGEYPSQLLDTLHDGVRGKWGDGTVAVPRAAEVRADARRCIESLVAAR